MAKVLLQEGEAIVSALKRFAGMTRREGLFRQIRVLCGGAKSSSEKRREKKKASKSRRLQAAARFEMLKKFFNIDPDVKASNDFGQNDDTSWATSDDTWVPDLSKPLTILPPSRTQWSGPVPAQIRKMMERRRLFSFGERFRKETEELLPSVHVCGIGEYQGETVIVRSLDDDGNERQKFSFPGGGVKEGETPEQAIKREYEEETGFKVEITGSPVFSTSIAKTKHTVICYPVKLVGGSPEKGDEIVELKSMSLQNLREFSSYGLSHNHLLSFQGYEKRLSYLAKLQNLAIQARTEARVAKASKKRAKGQKKNPPAPKPWVEINRFRRPRPVAPDQIKGGPMYRIADAMAELKKLGIEVTVRLRDVADKDKERFAQINDGEKVEADGCFLTNGQNNHFALTVKFPVDLKGARFITALQTGYNGWNLQPAEIFGAGESKAAVVKFISTYEVRGGYSTKFPENSLLLIVVRNDQLEVYRVGIATRIYDAADGGAHHFLIVQPLHHQPAQLYSKPDGNLATDSQDYDGFNSWPDLQRMVARMLNPKTLSVFESRKSATKTGKKLGEKQGRVIFFDVLKGFGFVEIADGSSIYFDWRQTVDSNDRLPYFKAGQPVSYTGTYDSKNGKQLVGVASLTTDKKALAGR